MTTKEPATRPTARPAGKRSGGTQKPVGVSTTNRAARVSGGGVAEAGGGVGSVAVCLVDAVERWSETQHDLVVTAALFAESGEWILDGSPTPAHWLAAVADVEACTAREWIRVGRQLADLSAIAEAFDTPAGNLSRALAAWFNRNTSPEDLDVYHQRQRSVKWRNEPDGMVTFNLRLPPFLAGLLIAFLTSWVMKTRPRPEPAKAGSAGRAPVWPSVAQQHADALQALLDGGPGQVVTEVIVHVRGDGATLDDGTPITDSVAREIAPTAFIRALIHDAERQPVNVSRRRRHPNTAQKRFVKERDRVCRDCGRQDLLEYDHVPPHHQTRHTTTDELELRGDVSACRNSKEPEGFPRPVPPTQTNHLKPKTGATTTRPRAGTPGR